MVLFLHYLSFLRRFLRIAYFFTPLMKFDANDVMYCVLPLYHTSAGVLGVGAALLSGYTMVVRRKFSASRFWEECIHYKATVSELVSADLIVNTSAQVK